MKKVFTETERKSLCEAIVASMKEHKPNKDGSCRAEGCDGGIVAQINGLFQGRYIHDTPFCDKCGRKYISAKGVPLIGHKEFNDMMNQPMTI